MIDTSNHISRDYFFSVLEQRLYRYGEAIFGRQRGGPNIFSYQHASIEKFKTLEYQDSFCGKGFWGYGFNTICNGIVSCSHLDVEEIKMVNNPNKHHEEYRKLLVLVFKVEGDFLFVSDFSIDSCTIDIKSKINTKYPLSDFENARLVTIKNKSIVEFAFKNIAKNIAFQVDDCSFPQNLYGAALVRYYFNGIKELASSVKKPEEVRINDVADNIDLRGELDSLKSKLRYLIVDTLTSAHSKSDFESLLTGDAKSQVRSCIKDYLGKHPNSKKEDFALLKDAIQFCNIEHLKKVIVKEDNWQLFEVKFNDKVKLIKYFEDLNEVRKAAMHNRTITKLISLEGRAAIEWFKLALGIAQ